MLINSSKIFFRCYDEENPNDNLNEVNMDKN